VRPRYWVPVEEVEARLRDVGWDQHWMLAIRSIARATDERTVLSSVAPRDGFGDSLALLFPSAGRSSSLAACLLAVLNSLVLDYAARTKIGNVNLNFYLVKQFPVPSPKHFTPLDIEFLTSRVQKLTCSWTDLRSWADTIGASRLAPALDESERQVIRAELDARIALLYGLSRDDLRFILDPQDVYGQDYPSETFRVLKDKEIRLFGEYRTHRLVLEAWDRMNCVERNPTRRDGQPHAQAAETRDRASS